MHIGYVIALLTRVSYSIIAPSCLYFTTTRIRAITFKLSDTRWACSEQLISQKKIENVSVYVCMYVRL
jgi:hypothetical protein